MHTGAFPSTPQTPTNPRPTFLFKCFLFRKVMWPINSDIYIVLKLPAHSIYHGRCGHCDVKICNYFTYHCELRWLKYWDWMRIEVLFVRRFNSLICWKSNQFPENWSWYSSLDRIGRRWEFQQITPNATKQRHQTTVFCKISVRINIA